VVRVLPITVAFALFLVAVIVMADTGRLGPLSEVYAFRYGDKAGHFVMLGIFTLLVDLALFQVMPRKSPFAVVLLAGTTIGALIGLEELSQLWMPRRNPDVFDLLASYAGIAMASVLALALRGMVTKQARRSTA
jgi:VanZ family protein